MGTPEDAALGLPLVMTGPDSTRTLDKLTTWGITLFGPCSANCYEYRSASGLYRWSSLVHAWFEQDDASCGYGTWEETKSNPPTIPPPDWQPHDGTKPGPTTPCRTDAASSSVAEATRKEHEAEAEHNACGVVESAAWDVLVGSGLTDEQHKLLSAYHTRVYRTRDAYIKLVHARAATSFAIRMNGGAK